MSLNLALIGQEPAFARGATQRSGPRPQGVGGVADGPGHAPAAPTHPLRPLQALRGPLRWWVCSLRGAGVVPGIPTPLPTRYTHPNTRPGPVLAPVHGMLLGVTGPRSMHI